MKPDVFYTLAIGLIGLICLGMMLAFSYNSEFEPIKDSRTMAVTALGLAGGSILKWFLKRIGSKDEPGD